MAIESNQKSSSAEKEDVTINEEPPVLPKNRFELELEFIQCLASPAYLHYLATSGLLSDPDFLAFLEYLTYWKQPNYIRFITYPHCLYFLNLLLTNERFRREIATVQFRNFVHEQQFYSWQFRSKHLYGSGLPKRGNDEENDGGNDPDVSMGVDRD